MFSSEEEFEREFSLLNKEDQIAKLHKLLAPHLLRRMKSDVMQVMFSNWGIHSVQGDPSSQTRASSSGRIKSSSKTVLPCIIDTKLRSLKQGIEGFSTGFPPQYESEIFLS